MNFSLNLCINFQEYEAVMFSTYISKPSDSEFIKLFLTFTKCSHILKYREITYCKNCKILKTRKTCCNYPEI